MVFSQWSCSFPAKVWEDMEEVKAESLVPRRLQSSWSDTVPWAVWVTFRNITVRMELDRWQAEDCELGGRERGLFYSWFLIKSPD